MCWYKEVYPEEIGWFEVDNEINDMNECSILSR